MHLRIWGARRLYWHTLPNQDLFHILVKNVTFLNFFLSLHMVSCSNSPNARISCTRRHNNQEFSNFLVVIQHSLVDRTLDIRPRGRVFEFLWCQIFFNIIFLEWLQVTVQWKIIPARSAKNNFLYWYTHSGFIRNAL